MPDAETISQIALLPAEKGLEAIANQLKSLNNRPGVYQMLGKNGEVLYVGKAKNLKKRVASYTRLDNHPYRIQRMISLVNSLNSIETETEVDALLLEISLIKKLKPKYNILLRDDKSFPYIVLTKHPKAARLMQVRLAKHHNANKIKGSWFGPFASVEAIRETMEILQKNFQIRVCSDIVYNNRTRPCLLHQIKKCSAPCTVEIEKDDYLDNVEDAKNFLNGRGKSLITSIRKKMNLASNLMQYEQAIVFREQLNALGKIFDHNGFHPQKFPEADLFAIVEKDDLVCVQIFFFRSYQNWGNKSFFTKLESFQDKSDILNGYVSQFYDSNPAPRMILLCDEIKDQLLLEQALSKRYGKKISIQTPVRGKKKYLVSMALQNAQSALFQYDMQQNRWQEQSQNFVKKYNLKSSPLRIEVYDNSHIQGSSAIGAMVVAGLDGMQKKHYRKYNIKPEQKNIGADDYAMLKQVLTRRFGKKNNPEFTATLPEVMIIDGGKGHLKIAVEVMENLQINIPLVFAIAKGKERNKGNEKIYQKDVGQVFIEKNDPCMYFFQRLRDEAHRFAINAHRQKRKKTIYNSSLTEMAGIGKQRKKALVSHFGSIAQIKKASVNELQMVKGISKNMAKYLYDSWNHM